MDGHYDLVDFRRRLPGQSGTTGSNSGVRLCQPPDPLGGIEMVDEKVKFEEFRVDGEQLLAKVKEIIHEGNVRRIIIKNEKGEVLVELPLTIGVVGALLIPVWAAVGAIAALAARLT